MADYISREAALTALQNPELFNVSPRFLQILRDIPAADVEPVRRWIPCSERPPEEIVPVNVVWVNHLPAPYYEEIKDVPQSGTAVYCNGNWYWDSDVCEDVLREYGENDADLIDEGIEITHWQPLPEPPKKGAAGNGLD